MKKMLLMACLMVALTANAQSVAKVGNVELGKPYAEALEAIKAEYGEPKSVTENEVTYGQVKHEGFTFQEASFRFKDGKFNEARFYQKAGGKAASQQKMESLAKELKKSTNMTRDIEDDGLWFYKGGKSPLGFGHLFTLCSHPKQGVWYSEMRYGPFNF